jgi:NAD-dependent deacetylase
MTGPDLTIQKAVSLLRSARHAVVFTGAGISTPSGIPDFQSKDTGLWQRFDPMEVASINVFRSKPEKFYGWLRPLLHEIWAAEPNPAHQALAELETAGIIKAVITQNIDNLHQRAGSKNIYEVHGSLRTMTCPRCNETMSAVGFREALAAENSMPHCPSCQTILKPDIVLYGEMLPIDIWTEAEAHCKQADVIIVAGSSLTVWPAAALPEVGLENGARLIINNRTPTPLDARAAVHLTANVADVIPEIARNIL